MDEINIPINTAIVGNSWLIMAHNWLIKNHGTKKLFLLETILSFLILFANFRKMIIMFHTSLEICKYQKTWKPKRKVTIIILLFWKHGVSKIYPNMSLSITLNETVQYSSVRANCLLWLLFLRFIISSKNCFKSQNAFFYF